MYTVEEPGYVSSVVYWGESDLFTRRMRSDLSPDWKRQIGAKNHVGGAHIVQIVILWSFMTFLVVRVD